MACGTVCWRLVLTAACWEWYSRFGWRGDFELLRMRLLLCKRPGWHKVICGCSEIVARWMILTFTCITHHSTNYLLHAFIKEIFEWKDIAALIRASSGCFLIGYLRNCSVDDASEEPWWSYWCEQVDCLLQIPHPFPLPNNKFLAYIDIFGNFVCK